MFTFLCTIALTVSAAFSSVAIAQNRQSADAIFNEPKGSAVSQILFTAGDLIAFHVVRPKLPSGAALGAAEARVMDILASNVSDADKVQALRNAETELSKARLSVLQSMERGVIPTVIKYGRIVGTTLVLVDIFGRAWVWGALNANPTWSPAITMLQHNGAKLSRQYALPE